MDKIPSEILLQVFDHLAGPPPSQDRLHHEPRPDLLDLDSETPRPLRSVSLVSRSWRTLALPQLFRHVLWKPSVLSLTHFTINPIPLLDFLDKNRLSHNVESLTLLTDFVDPLVPEQGVTPHIRSVDLDWLWKTLFATIDPLRFTFMAPPSTLAAFMSRELPMDETWSFDHRFTIISLSRTSRELRGNQSDAAVGDPPAAEIPSGAPETAQPEQRRPRSALVSRYLAPRPKGPPPCLLFTIRPWASLLLNEGSFIQAYSRFEHRVKRPPSMLKPLLGGLNVESTPIWTKGLIPPTVVDFSYVAIFPFLPHFSQLLVNFPKIQRWFLQITPGPESTALQDDSIMEGVPVERLWEERDLIHQYLIDESAYGPEEAVDNFHGLKVFESGDPADREFWEGVTLHVSGNQWDVRPDGVMTLRREVASDNRLPDADLGIPTHDDASSLGWMNDWLPRSLERFAFNGVIEYPSFQ